MKPQNDINFQFLALDFGAESGRGELITLRENKVQIDEIHRFPNRPVFLCLKWDTSADPWNYDRMMAEASQAKSGSIIDVADGCLLAPDEMEASLLDLAHRLQQP